MSDRNPLATPSSGDWFTNGKRTLAVHEVARGQVYFTRWENAAPDDVAFIRVPLTEWTRLCAQENARLVPEDERTDP